MKTPEEIKKGLECCADEGYSCAECPYESCSDDWNAVERDALAYIQQLEVEQADMMRFKALRSKVFKAIAAQLAIDSHCKSYEGTFEVVMGWPDYFEDEQMTAQPWVHIILHCYVLGPARHYEWKGRTFAEALDKAEKEISGWIDSEEEQC